jgi:hypothetical protein
MVVYSTMLFAHSVKQGYKFLKVHIICTFLEFHDVQQVRRKEELRMGNMIYLARLGTFSCL